MLLQTIKSIFNFTVNIDGNNGSRHLKLKLLKKQFETYIRSITLIFIWNYFYSSSLSL